MADLKHHDRIDRIVLEIMRLKHELATVGKEVEQFTDPRLLHISQRLDEKLNEYYRLKRHICECRER